MDEVLLSEEMIRSRTLKGFVAQLSRALLVSIPILGVIFLLEVPQWLGWLIFPEQYLGLFLALTLSVTFLVVPEGVSGHRDRVPWYDFLAAAGGMVVGLYVFINYLRFANSLGDIYPDRVIMGCVAVLLLSEATRRLTGWSLAIIAAAFLFYAFFAYLRSEERRVG